MKRFQGILLAAPVDRTNDPVDWLDGVVRRAETGEIDWKLLVDPPPQLPGQSGAAWTAEDEAGPAASHPHDCGNRRHQALTPPDITSVPALSAWRPR